MVEKKKARKMQFIVLSAMSSLLVGAWLAYAWRATETADKADAANKTALESATPCDENDKYECGIQFLDLQTGETRRVLKQKPEPPTSEWPTFADRTPTDADQQNFIQVYMTNRDFWGGDDGTASVCSYHHATDGDVAHITCAEIGRLEISPDMRWLSRQPLFDEGS